LLCLRWLAVTLISSEDFAAAEPILKQWQAAAPGSIEVQRYREAVQSRLPAPAEATEGKDASASAADVGRLLRLDHPSLPASGLLPPHVGALPSAAHDLTAGK